MRTAALLAAALTGCATPPTGRPLLWGPGMGSALQIEAPRSEYAPRARRTHTTITVIPDLPPAWSLPYAPGEFDLNRLIHTNGAP